MPLAQYFCGIGAEKTGTSWICDVLGAHPDIWMSPMKELHYFDQRFLPMDWWREIQWNELLRYSRIMAQEPSYKALKNVVYQAKVYGLGRLKQDWLYQAYFCRPKPWVGEISPSYCMLPKQGFERIKSLYPNVKIIYGMREPFDRTLSGYHHTRLILKELGQPDIDFETYANRWTTNVYNQYDQTLENLFNVFPSEQLLIYYYEEVFASPDTLAQFIEQLNAFFGISTRPEQLKFAHQRINAVKRLIDVPQPDWFAQRYTPVQERVKELMGYIPNAWETTQKVVI